jgi:starvation-inducible outer membrane lipoprotein
MRSLARSEANTMKGHKIALHFCLRIGCTSSPRPLENENPINSEATLVVRAKHRCIKENSVTTRVRP